MNQYSNQTLEPNTLNSENLSRNPELWTTPYNQNGVATGGAVGKLSDSNGNPVGGKHIIGLEKPVQAGGDGVIGSCGNGYVSSLTYNQPWTNPDDILVENFATTDVAPGTYHLYAFNSYNYTTCTGNLYRDLGTYTFEAGRTTYIGLYPNYLPDVRSVPWWTTYITVRNNSTSRTAQVNTTYFWSASGTVYDQRQDFISPNASLTFTAPGSLFVGSAQVIASEDVSVIAENVYGTSGFLAGAYPGETSTANRYYAPLVLYNWPSLNPNWLQTSELVIQNVSSQTASVSVDFYDSDGNGSSNFSLQPFELDTGAQAIINPATISLPIWNSTYGATLASAVIISSHPIAVVVRNQVNDSSGVQHLYGTYKAFTDAGAAALNYLPLVTKEYYNYDTGMQVQNVSSGESRFQVKYYDAAGTLVYNTGSLTVAGYRSRNLWRPSSLSSGFLGSAVAEVISGGPLVALGQYDYAKGSDNSYATMQYEAITTATRRAAAPRTDDTPPWGWTGIQAQNMGPGTLPTLRLDFYNSSGGSEEFAFKLYVAPYSSVNFFNELSSVRKSANATSSDVGYLVNRAQENNPSGKDFMMGYSVVK